MTGPIFLVVGPPAAGKTTTSRALAMRFARGMHVPVDALRELVVSGLALPGDVWTDEATLQLALARRAASRLALDYAAEGFAVAIDDFVDPFGLADYAELLERPGTHPVLLVPSMDAAHARNVARSGDGDAAAFIAHAIPAVYSYLDPYRERSAREGWIVVDSTDLTVEETVDAILARTP